MNAEGGVGSSPERYSPAQLVIQYQVVSPEIIYIQVTL